MPTFSNGIHFTDPRQLQPFAAVTPASFGDGASHDATTAAFFTSIANRGLQDQTDWTADTYKTIANLTFTNGGLIAMYIGPTCGGVETHTTRWTIDGGTPITVTLTPCASGKRPVLSAMFAPTSVTTGLYTIGNEVVNSDKATFVDVPAATYFAPIWSGLNLNSIPCLYVRSSLLLEAKNSASITNSTATAYSGLVYKKFLAS